MIREGFFVSQPTRIRQSYRTEPFYRHTFTLGIVAVTTIVITVCLYAGCLFLQSRLEAHRSDLAVRESEVKQEESRLEPTVNRINVLKRLRRRLEKRVPASRMLAAIEAVTLSSPNVCVRQIDLENVADAKNQADIDRWSVVVQAVSKGSDRKIINEFKEALARELPDAAISFLESPSANEVQPKFVIQIQLNA